MEIDNEREGEVGWATYKQKEREKQVETKAQSRETEKGAGLWETERVKHQLWGQVLLSARKHM